MIPEIGHFSLILAACLALLQAVVPLWGAQRNHIAYMQLARYTAWGQFIFVGLSFFILMSCFISNDFSVAYVAENSNRHLPLLYRVCGVWGAHEGSLLLWLFILSVWGFLVSIFSRNLPLMIYARVLAVMAIIALGFDGFLLTTSDPFIRLLPNFPIDGRSLNPLLQDPGLALHPPMLYMGYVGFSVAFAFAIAALLTGKLDAAWARWSRPWTLAAWCFLTVGIVMGSAWAYRDLGWGGWWFWDPVENASFLPWLAGTALIHSLIVTEKRDVFKAWTVLLAVVAFSLSLFGTFLVRSGILISVHAFAVDPKRGLYMLGFLSVVVGASLSLYAWRGRLIVNTGKFDLLSRESMLLANNVLLFIGMLTVLLGTLYPLVMSALHLQKLSVGAPYFNEVFVPLMLPMFFLMGLGPWFQWVKMDGSELKSRAIYIGLFAIAAAALLPFILATHWYFKAMLGLFIAFWIILQNLSLLRRRKTWRLPTQSQLAMLCAHVGVGVLIIGISLTSVYSQQRNLSLQPGDKVTLGPYVFQLKNIAPMQGPNYQGYRAKIVIREDNKILTTLYPEQRVYPIAQTALARTAISANIWRDLYVALGSPLPGNAWAVRIYYKPFVRWIWFGGL
ncbi:MAG: heme lyase CcmF/NrfE family subunit, partial [Gammaproteobacteria bacterium]|nr:heme lyase CcmF/NrfE family subunit [Gammaproteobacteria bacterium]